MWFVNYSANAQNIDQNFINQQDWITRDQQNKFEENYRLKEQESINNEAQRRKKQQKENEIKPEVKSQAGECFAIKTIALIDGDSISKSQQQNLVSSFIGQCASSETLNQIIAKIQNYYNDKGYVTSRVLVSKQNIQSGNLQLKILEGKIAKVIVGKNRFIEKMQGFTAFGMIESKPLNLHNINQGLYQINRLSSNNATMKIQPADEDGKANVYIENNKKYPENLPARATIGYDNLGNDFTGVRRTNFSGTFDNLLFLNDSLNINYSTNLNDDSKKKDIKSFSANISIPFAYNTFSYDYSISEFRGTNAGIVDSIRITGFSQRNNLAIERVILDKGNFRLLTIGSLTTKSSASYINQQKITTSQRKLTVANLAFSLSNQFKNGVSIYLKPSYSKGLKLLNANQDQNNLALNIPKAQFDYFKLYGSISKKIIIPKIQIPFVISTEFDSQYSKHTLFGSEQFSVGGYHSVRGFRENFITGDSGYYFRNKASLNIGSMTAPFVKNDKGFLQKNLAHLNKFSIEPFFDYGYVKNKYIINGADGSMSGGGIKTIFNGKYFRSSLTYASAIKQSRLINSSKKENKLIYFEISASCCN